MFALLLRLALAGAASAGTLVPLAGRVVRPVGRLVGRVAGRSRSTGAAGRRTPSSPSKRAGAAKGALVAGGAGVGGAVVVDTLLDDGSIAPVIVPSGGSVPRASRRKSDVVRLSQLEVVKDILSDPIYSFLLGYLVVEFAQKNGFAGELSGSVAQIAMGGIAYAKAISPLVSKIGPAATQVEGPGALGIPGFPLI